MSLHWTLIAGFLYAEIVVVLLFLLPFVSNRAWSKLFKSNFLKGLENQFIYYFYILVDLLDCENHIWVKVLDDDWNVPRHF